jgi:integrase/recombinase XerD
MGNPYLATYQRQNASGQSYHIPLKNPLSGLTKPRIQARNMKEARQIQTERQRQLDLSMAPQTVRDATVSELGKIFIDAKRFEGKRPKTISNYQTAIKHLCSYASDKVYYHFNRQDARQFQRYLAGAGYANSSVNTQMRHVGAIFQWAVDEEYLNRNPFRKIGKLTEDRNAKMHLTQLELEQVLHKLESQIESKKGWEIFLYFNLLLITGARREELALITPDRFDSDKLLVNLIPGKTGTDRICQLPQFIWPDIQMQLKQRQGKVKFFSFCGDWFMRRIKEALTECGIHIAQPIHCIRHTIKSITRYEGIPREHAEFHLGHAVAGVEGIYDHSRFIRDNKSVQFFAKIVSDLNYYRQQTESTTTQAENTIPLTPPRYASIG